jgi:thiamine kinase-like enzyme
MGAGPFDTYDEMAGWFDMKRFDSAAGRYDSWGCIPKELDYPRFDLSQPLVLCHMDLHMRNILVDREGVLWLIDWEMAGAYPRWMEYARWVVPNIMNPAPKLWIWAAQWVVGRYEKYVAYLRSVAYGLERCYDNIYSPDYFEKKGIQFA